MLANLLEALYNKVIVNIVVNRSTTDVYIELCSKNGTVDSDKNSFDTVDLSKEMFAYISSHIKESPYYYISILDISKQQGAFPTCAKNRLSYFYEVSASEHKCYDESWTYYTSKTDLYTLEKVYAKSGVDFVFSPFTLLNNFFQDKINSNVAMYILIQEASISLAVFDTGKLLFAEHLDMELKDENEDVLLNHDIDESEDLEIDSGIDLEDIDVIDDLDDFGDIEDLDSIEDIDQFSQSQDVEEEFYESQESEVESEDDDVNEDYQRFTLIQNSVGTYYADDKYKGDFIENVYIADGMGATTDLKRYLEEEMFLNVYIRHIEVCMELSSLAKMELNI